MSATHDLQVSMGITRNARLANQMTDMKLPAISLKLIVDIHLSIYFMREVLRQEYAWVLENYAGGSRRLLPFRSQF
jgi:hypothetical protein